MHHLLEKDLLNTLSRWLDQLKNPYHAQTPHQQASIELRPGSFPNSTMQITLNSNQSLKLSFIHPLDCVPAVGGISAFRKECRQFNTLMEHINLPAYVWENKNDQRFELRWEETVIGITELRVLSGLFKQSLYLSNALSSQLGWRSAQGIQKTVH